MINIIFRKNEYRSIQLETPREHINDQAHHGQFSWGDEMW